MNNKGGGDIISFQYRHRKEIIIGIIATIILGIIIFLVITNQNDNEKIVEEKTLTKKETKESETLLRVDIKGEVISPGIYSLKESSRVIDVIELAGGLTENADTSVINLSKKITDEMVIIIYSKEQVKSFEETKKLEQQKIEKCISPDDISLHNDACISDSINNSNKININNASKEELMSLPGIGSSKAEDIINYRNQNGPFTQIEDILNVSGIGENVFAQIKENITI